jgi:hypothetical protein
VISSRVAPKASQGFRNTVGIFSLLGDGFTMDTRKEGRKEFEGSGSGLQIGLEVEYSCVSALSNGDEDVVCSLVKDICR